VLLLHHRLAGRILKLLSEDEEDLFYESGRVFTELRRALTSTSSPLSATFLTGLMTACRTAEDAAVLSKVTG
jgi:hypothetical protein